MSQKLSARSVLSNFGPVFTSAELTQRMNWGLDKAAVYLSRWKKAELVESVAPRSGLFFNLSAYPESARNNLDAAIKHLMPSVLRVGVRLLYEEGLITQHVHGDELAVLDGDSRYQVSGVSLLPRGRRWYDVMSTYITDEPTIPELSPGAALAEALLSKETSWCPAPDDIELDMSSEVVEQDFMSVLPRLLRLRGIVMEGPLPHDAANMYRVTYEKLHGRQVEKRNSMGSFGPG